MFITRADAGNRFIVLSKILYNMPGNNSFFLSTNLLTRVGVAAAVFFEVLSTI